MNHRKHKFLLKIIIICCYIISYPIHATLENDHPVTIQSILTLQSDYVSNIMSSGGRLTITGSGTIHFLQAFFYSDTSCTTLLGAASAIDNVSGLAFTNGQTISINSSSVYQLANNQGITTGKIACMKIYINGSNQSSDGISCQNFTDESCSGTSCTSNQTKSVSWGASPSACATQYAYVTNSGNNSISKCTVNNTGGTFSSCGTTTGGFNNSRGTFLNNEYLYVVNQTGSKVSKCTVSSSDGAISNCGTTGSGFNAPYGIALNNQYAYVVNGGTSGSNRNAVQQCTVSSTDGTLSSCTTIASGLTSPRGIAINNGFAYVCNSTSNSVVLYSVNSSDGTFSSVVATHSGFTNPLSIAFYNGYAYIVNGAGNTVSKCTVNSTDGRLSSCGTTGSGFSGPIGIFVNNGFAYVANNNTTSTVSLCSISGVDGSLTCSSTAGSGFSTPRFGYIF